MAENDLSLWPWPEVPPRAPERLLLAALDEFTGERISCASLGRGQFAYIAARQFPEVAVECWYLDLYRAQLAEALIGSRPANLEITCTDSFPAQSVDLVALPITTTGDGELVRELMQTAYVALCIGGLFAAATDNPCDSWLGEQMRKLFPHVSQHPHDDGVLYLARKTDELKKLKQYDCEIIFRDGPRLLKGLSRPGVFSHRHVDPGARRLMEAMLIEPGQRVFDIGCGWGAVSIAAAARAAGVYIEALDSNARAVACTVASAHLNGLEEHIHVELRTDGLSTAPGTFDLALANPPYYADFRIAELFVTAAHQALRPGGTLLIVTKLPNWYLEKLPTLFDDVEPQAIKGYYVVRARQP